MKVYELMERLAEMPAGAELVVSTILSAEDLKKHEVMELAGDGDTEYRVTGTTDDIEMANEKRVYLYVSM
ncbi:MAG: hypothetical protein IJN42_01835 [Clostridia bacterium]|nr:hypothetical protein [Clostridia bacterium]